MKLRTAIILVSLSVLLGSYLELAERGFYDPTFNLLICHSRDVCLHEIGHAVDDQAGWVSDGAEYREVLFHYILEDLVVYEEINPWTVKILFFPGFFSPYKKEGNIAAFGYWNEGWGGAKELYADMLVWCDGDRNKMPVEFARFYDWELVAKLIERHIER